MATSKVLVRFVLVALLSSPILAAIYPYSWNLHATSNLWSWPSNPSAGPPAAVIPATPAGPPGSPLSNGFENVSEHHPIILSPLCYELLRRIYVYRQPVPTLYCPIQVPVRLSGGPVGPPAPALPPPGPPALPQPAVHPHHHPLHPVGGPFIAQPIRDSLKVQPHGSESGSYNVQCRPGFESDYRCVQRPLLYVPGFWRCYYAFSQGPCKPTEWIVPTATTDINAGGAIIGECRPNTCRSQYFDATLSTDPAPTSAAYDAVVDEWFPTFTFEHNGACYTTNTTGFCGSDLVVGFTDSQYQSPTCLSPGNFQQACGLQLQSQTLQQGVGYALSTPAALSCPEGTTKRDDGECVTPSTFE